MATSKARQAAAATRTQGTALGGIAAGETEDMRRAAGTDASATAGEHDDSPEARKNQIPGGQVIDTYATSAGSVHDNRSDPGPELVLGQAPSAPAVPMRGSKAYNEKFHPAIPNAINRSPMVHGALDDKLRGQAPSFEDKKAYLLDEEGEDEKAEGDADKAPKAGDDLAATT